MKLLLIVTCTIAIVYAYQRRNFFGYQADNNFKYHPPWFTVQTPGPPEPENIPRELGTLDGDGSHGHPDSSGSSDRLIPLYRPPWHKPTTTTERPHVYPNYPTHDRFTTQRTTTPADLSIYVESCVAACPMVGDYIPVCGTNNVSYANIEKLECAKQCGVAVELSSSNSCQPQKPVNSIPDVISACISTCSVTSEFNPVCGTDNVTYPNLGRFECAKNCGRDIEISRMSSCLVPPGPGNPDLRLTTTESPKINENDNNGGSKINGDSNCNANGGNVKKPSVTEVIACMQLCPMTIEVNPVCGTDGVTYTNPGKLLCTQFCGVEVKVQKFSTCSGEPLSTAQPTCPCTTPTTPTTEDCIRRCPVTQELKPVCGSDGVTYINLASLQCKMGCGVDVSVQKLSPCGEPSTNPPTTPSWNNTDRTTPTVTPTTPTPSNVQTCIDKCYVTPEHKPVCGTNGQTYDSLARLRCAKRCGINVDVKKLTACDAIDPEPAFTISPDILASIFPEDFKSTTPKDSGEDYDIRFGD